MQDRPGFAGVHRAIDGAGDRGWQQDQDDLAALVAHVQDPVAVFLTEVAAAGTAGFEDPKADRYPT